MQVVCKDGTTINCHDFEATESGVLFFQRPPVLRSETEDEEEESEDDELGRASGFIPISELRFVLPDELVRQPGPQRGGQAEPGSQFSSSVPPQQGGESAGQQQMRQDPDGSLGR